MMRLGNRSRISDHLFCFLVFLRAWVRRQNSAVIQMRAVRSRSALCRREMGSGSFEIKPRQKASAEVDGENPTKDLVKQEPGQRGCF